MKEEQISIQNNEDWRDAVKPSGDSYREAKEKAKKERKEKIKKFFKNNWFFIINLFFALLFVILKNYRLIMGGIYFSYLAVAFFIFAYKNKNRLGWITAILMSFIALISFGTEFLLPKYIDLFIFTFLLATFLVIIFYYFNRNKESILEKTLVSLLLTIVSITNIKTMNNLIENVIEVKTFLFYGSLIIFLAFTLFTLFVLVKFILSLIKKERNNWINLISATIILIIIGGYSYLVNHSSNDFIGLLRIIYVIGIALMIILKVKEILSKFF